MNTNHNIIAKAFEEHRDALINYVSCRINDRNEAEDIVQDTFIRLMDYDVITEATVKNLVFTIANNIVIDHLRRHYKRQEVYSYVYDMMQKQTPLTPGQIAVFHDLAEQERCVMQSLSPSAARVYEMTRVDGMSIEEIALTLNLSRRTVECHQFKSRKIVREEMKKVM